MRSRDLRDLVHFDAERVRRETVYETERLWAQVLCFERNQSHGPVSDPGSDAILQIVAGEAVVLIGIGRKRLKQWETALVPAGSELSITNASAEPLVVLVVAAPPPSVTEPETATGSASVDPSSDGDPS